MPLQNRIDPFSNFHAVKARGMFTGNRGIIHDHETQTILKTSWATEGWVICTLAPLPGREKRKRLMSKGKWTELFFLDEATGLAAGHRPCFACQRERADAFGDAAGVAKIRDLNPLIHAEMKPRIRMRQPQQPMACNPRDLPDGAMFAVGQTPYLKWHGAAREWSFNGYAKPTKLPDTALRLTPNITCKALANGYIPRLHKSLNT